MTVTITLNVQALVVSLILALTCAGIVLIHAFRAPSAPQDRAVGVVCAVALVLVALVGALFV